MREQDLCVSSSIQLPYLPFHPGSPGTIILRSYRCVSQETIIRLQMRSCGFQILIYPLCDGFSEPLTL